MNVQRMDVNLVQALQFLGPLFRRRIVRDRRSIAGRFQMNHTLWLECLERVDERSGLGFGRRFGSRGVAELGPITTTGKVPIDEDAV